MYAQLAWPKKNPEDILDYTVDWTTELTLLEPPDSIASVAWTIPTPLTKGAETNSGTTTTVFISGGVANKNYEIGCRIVTAAGRRIKRTIILPVRNA